MEKRKIKKIKLTEKGEEVLTIGALMLIVIITMVLYSARIEKINNEEAQGTTTVNAQLVR